MPKAKINMEKQLEDHVITYKECYYRLAYSYVRNSEDALIQSSSNPLIQSKAFILIMPASL
jgi:RNA polymerase sigma-70 factor (ECF subfamily)